jgi:uncharacterized protein
MKTLNEIQKILAGHKNDLFSKYPIQSLAIFGSFARGEQNEKSDLDIVVEFNDKIGIRFIDLADEIENIIGVKTDLVSKNGIKAKYFKKINKDLIYV